MKRFLYLPVAIALVVLAACGSDDGSTAAGAGGADRTIEVEMRDIAYSPTSVDVRVGETVRFNFKNTGQVEHDAFIGDAAGQDAHEKQMREGHDHGNDPNALSVKPGKSASLTHTFDKAGQVLIGCHEPGHYTGGMKITVNVA
ncbi:MAG TPA: cupredoxin domain-containing protein [Acidimicrobiales bacterium]|nr:cupredoxin domain-containing protein [Acidimicrobiales bacterium]